MMHGDHWRAFVDTDEEILARFEHAIRTGDPLPPTDVEVPEGGFYYTRSQDRPLCSIAVIQKKNSEFHAVGCHPLPMTNEKNELEVFSVEPSIDPETGRDGEGFVKAITRDGTEVSFTCPAFGMFEDRMTRHPRFIFGLSAIAYSAHKMEEEISITEGQFFEHAKRKRLEDNPELDPASITSIPISLANMRCYMAHGEEGDFAFQSRVDEVVPFESLGVKGHILLMNLSAEDKAPLRISIFAGKNAIGDWVPKVGDLVDGVGWMLGVPLEPVEVDKLWMDSAEASEKEAGWDAMMEGFSFMFSNPNLPLAWQIVGGAFVAAGWEITASDIGLYRLGHPAFEFTKGGERVRAFVRTRIKGFCEAPDWPDLVEIYEEHSTSQGVDCLRITVTLTTCGEKNFDVSVEGLDGYSDRISPILGARRPEFLQPVEIGEEEAPPAIFIESEAAEKFAHGINSCDLSDFSQIMVEDFEYDSRAMDKIVKGRSPTLSYFGQLLGYWNDRDLSPTCRLAKVVLDGSERTAALLFPKGESDPINGAFFSGRNGYASAIRVLPPDRFEILELEENPTDEKETE